MKKTFSLLSFVAASLLSFSAFAQEDAQVLVPNTGNWFIGVGGGVNFVFDNMKFNNPAPAAQLYFGKWFTPGIGFRAGYNGLKDNAPVNTTAWFSGTDSFYNHFVHVDALWNLRNTYSYKEKMVWQPILYLQAGGLLAHTTLQNRCWAFGLGGGFQNLFRLGKVVSLSIDLSAVLAPEKPYRSGTGRFIVLPTATAGLVFNLGKRFETSAPVPAVDPNIVGNLKSQLSSANEKLSYADQRIALLEDQVAKLSQPKEEPAPEPVAPVIVAPATPEILYFELGKTTLDPREQARLEYYAEKTFKKDQKLLITGGADLGTGSREVNERLSKQRAEYVKRVLVNQFGYNPANLETKADVIPSDSPIKGRIVTIEVK